MALLNAPLMLIALPLAALVSACDWNTAPPAERQSTEAEDADFARMVSAGKMLPDLREYLEEGDPAPRTFTFDRLIFDPGSSKIRAVDEQTLFALANLLREHPKVRARILGFDDGGNSGGNSAVLALRRASAVVRFLKEAGVANRIEGAGGNQGSGSRATQIVVLEK
jgi:outer membrane protein OmpA-like peptidoglycan-associated protein